MQDKLTTVTLADGRSFSVTGDTNLLSQLEDKAIEIHYHCREGFCGACRTRLVKGEINYLLDPLAFIDDDEFLPCCSVPVTDIEIDISE